MNANTLANALVNAGVAADTPLSLSNPGGNNPWLFTVPASYAANAGNPVTLDVPCVAGEAAFTNFLNGTALPGKQMWYADGRAFLVRACGTVQPNVYSKTLKLFLFVGNGLNSGVAGQEADELLLQTSTTLPAQATNSAYANWYIEAKCLWDSASLTLNGVASGMVAGTAISASAFSIVNPTQWVAQQAAGSYKPISFVIGANLNSSANPSADVVQLNEFTAEAL